MTTRVLQISKEFQPLSSGVARHIQGLAQALSDDPAIELRLMAPVMDSAAAPCPTQPGGYRALWQQLGDCNVVHLHGARTPFVAAAAALAWLRRCPVVYTPHCYYDTGSRWQRRLKRGWDRTVERALVRKAGAVVLLHDGWRDDLARRGLHPRRIVTVPNCIDERRDGLAPSALRLEGQPALLSIGRLDPIKRLDDVIAALGQPELCSAILHVVGQGPDRARLEAVAQDLGVAERVRFHGWQDDAATNNMMMGCDAMVLASAREGMPTVVLEALLAGVPIACSDIDGNRAILTAVGWEATFALGDIAALAQCAARTAKREVPSEVRQTVRTCFTWGGQAPRLAATYLELAAGPRYSWHRRLALALTNYDNPRSLATRFRVRRLAPLLELIDAAFARHGRVNIIDVGGTVRYWRLLSEGFIASRQVHITLVNTELPKIMPTSPYFTFVQGDGCDLEAFASGTFHIGHSNSVIEHVGDLSHMARFALELRRVSERYFIQTPDFWFPLEPHCMTPVFHWLPRRLKLWLVQRVALGHWPKAKGSEEAIALVDSARLLSRRQLQVLLPDARILHERVLGLSKSLIALSP